MCTQTEALKHIVCLLSLLTILPATLSAQEDAVERDAYFWGYYEFAFEFHKDWSIDFKNQVRLNENATRFDYTAVDLGLSHKTTRWLRLSATYRYNLKNDLESGWLSRHQFRGNILFRHRFDDLLIDNRNRFQSGVEDVFGGADVSSNNFFYRNRTRLKYDFSARWSVYAYFEAYFRLGPVEQDEGYIYRTRFGAGADYTINSRESIRLFVVQDEQVRGGRPSQRYFVGFGYSRTFELE